MNGELKREKMKSFLGHDLLKRKFARKSKRKKESHWNGKNSSQNRKKNELKRRRKNRREQPNWMQNERRYTMRRRPCSNITVDYNVFEYQITFLFQAKVGQMTRHTRLYEDLKSITRDAGNIDVCENLICM